MQKKSNRREERRLWAKKFQAMIERERKKLMNSPMWAENYERMRRDFNYYLILRIEAKLRAWGK